MYPKKKIYIPEEKPKKDVVLAEVVVLSQSVDVVNYCLAILESMTVWVLRTMSRAQRF
jgi:hypothetical protein